MKRKGISLIIIIIVIAVILVLSVALILNIYKTNYQAKATSTAGYQISKDAGGKMGKLLFEYIKYIRSTL